MHKQEDQVLLLNWLEALAVWPLLIALLWQEYIAVIFKFEVFWYDRVVLGLSIWLVYIADRWMDVVFENPNEILGLRHQIIGQFRKLFLLAFISLFIINSYLVFTFLSTEVLKIGLIIAGLWLFYALVISKKTPTLKPYFVSALFCIGTILFYHHRSAQLIDYQYYLCVGAYFIFLLSNTLFIYNYERERLSWSHKTLVRLLPLMGAPLAVPDKIGNLAYGFIATGLLLYFIGSPLILIYNRISLNTYFLFLDLALIVGPIVGISLV